MRLLLDTHVFVWACVKDARLRAPTRAAITDSGNDVQVSAASAWEIAIKHAAGRLQFPIHKWADMLIVMGYEALSIQPHHGLAAGALPRHHLDPFDRMLVAQARCEGLTLVTSDRAIKMYDLAVLEA